MNNTIENPRNVYSIKNNYTPLYFENGIFGDHNKFTNSMLDSRFKNVHLFKINLTL